MKAGDLVVSRDCDFTSIYEKGKGHMYHVTGTLYPDQVALVISHEMSTGVTRILSPFGAVGLISDQYLRVVS